MESSLSRKEKVKFWIASALQTGQVARKSTACGVFRVGGCALATYSRGLATISLSSGEAEFNGGVVACCEGLFYQQILAHLGVNVKMRVHVDSSAARGVFQRQGAGRIRHLEVLSA